MGFRSPILTATASETDTGATPTGPGVRVYQRTDPDGLSNPRGAVEFRSGIAGVRPALFSAESYQLDQGDGLVRLLGSVVFVEGYNTLTAGARLELAERELPAGGHESAAVISADVVELRGPLRIPASGDASETSTAHAFQIGPTTGLNVIIDNNEIIFRNNGAPATANFGPSPISVVRPQAASHVLRQDMVRSGLGAINVAAVGVTYTAVIPYGGTFAGTPSVSVTPLTTIPQHVFMSIAAVGTTSFTAYLHRTSGTGSTSFRWIASDA